MAYVSIRVPQEDAAGRLEEAKERVSRLPGVVRVVVDHANDLLRAEYDPDQIASDAIRAAAGGAKPKKGASPRASRTGS